MHTHRHPREQGNQRGNVAPMLLRQHQQGSIPGAHEIKSDILYHKENKQREPGPYLDYGVRNVP